MNTIYLYKPPFLRCSFGLYSVAFTFPPDLCLPLPLQPHEKSADQFVQSLDVVNVCE